MFYNLGARYLLFDGGGGGGEEDGCEPLPRPGAGDQLGQGEVVGGNHEVVHPRPLQVEVIRERLVVRTYHGVAAVLHVTETKQN
jgi:hypothetical protein